MNVEKLEKAKAAFDADDPQASALIHKQKLFLAKPWDLRAYSEAPVMKPVEYFKTCVSSAIEGSVTISMV